MIPLATKRKKLSESPIRIKDRLKIEREGFPTTRDNIGNLWAYMLVSPFPFEGKGGAF